MSSFDPAKIVFTAAVEYLGESGVPERQARSLIGKWRKDHTDAALFSAFCAAHKASVSDPVPWLVQYLTKNQDGPRKPWCKPDLPSQPAGWGFRLECWRDSERRRSAWPRTWGPMPGELGCQAPPQLLVNADFLPTVRDNQDAGGRRVGAPQGRGMEQP